MHADCSCKGLRALIGFSGAPEMVGGLVYAYLESISPLVPSSLHITAANLTRNDPATATAQLRALLTTFPANVQETIQTLLKFENVDSIAMALLSNSPGAYSVARILHSERQYVAKVASLPSSGQPFAKPTLHPLNARALYDFPGDSKWLLGLNSGCQLELLDVKAEPGWMKGRRERDGFFPSAYITVVPDSVLLLESKSPSSRSATPSDSPTKSTDEHDGVSPDDAPKSLFKGAKREKSVRKLGLHDKQPRKFVIRLIVPSLNLTKAIGALSDAQVSAFVVDFKQRLSDQMEKEGVNMDSLTLFHVKTGRWMNDPSKPLLSDWNIEDGDELEWKPTASGVTAIKGKVNRNTTVRAVSPSPLGNVAPVIRSKSVDLIPIPNELAPSQPPPTFGSAIVSGSVDSLVVRPKGIPPPLNIALNIPPPLNIALNIPPPKMPPKGVPGKLPASIARSLDSLPPPPPDMLPPPPDMLPPPPALDMLPPPPALDMLPPPPIDSLPPPPTVDLKSFPLPLNLPPPPSISPELARKAPPSPALAVVDEESRRVRAEEVVTTEETYVQQLNMLFTAVIQPLTQLAGGKTEILTRAEILSMFSNAEVIMNCHFKLMHSLRERMAGWKSNPRLGDVFLENTSFFKLYKHYVNNFDKSVIALKECRSQNKRFKEFLEKLEYTERLSKLSLDSFLILPVQRIPRYVLLLKELLRVTPSTHPDHEDLGHAHDAARELADYINRNKSDADTLNQIYAIKEQIEGYDDLIATGRRFIRQGSAKRKAQVELFLFSDILLIAKHKKKKNKFRFESVVELSKAQIDGASTFAKPNSLVLITLDGRLELIFDRPEVKKEWREMIEKCIAESIDAMLSMAFGAEQQLEGSRTAQAAQAEQNAARRFEIAQKLLSSELEYVNKVQLLWSVFWQPLKSVNPNGIRIVGLSEALVLCSNSEELANSHARFAELLRDRVAEWSTTPSIADIFSSQSALLQLYRKYFADQSAANDTLEDLLKSDATFILYIGEREKQNKCQVQLLMQAPLRRVSDYYLLLQEMMQFTTAKDSDHAELAAQVASLRELTQFLTNPHNNNAPERLGRKK
jgi:hypothetical protein